MSKLFMLFVFIAVFRRSLQQEEPIWEPESEPEPIFDASEGGLNDEDAHEPFDEPSYDSEKDINKYAKELHRIDQQIKDEVGNYYPSQVDDWGPDKQKIGITVKPINTTQLVKESSTQNIELITIPPLINNANTPESLEGIESAKSSSIQRNAQGIGGTQIALIVGAIMIVGAVLFTYNYSKKKMAPEKMNPYNELP